MIIRSELPYKRYLCELKANLGSIFSLGEERVAGTVIWRFFSITSHAGHEWNRRITNEKQRAIGFAKPDGDGTKIYCIRLAGLTNPISLVGLYLFGILVFLAKGGFTLASGGLSSDIWWLCLVVTLVTAGITALTDSWTERGMEAYRTLTAYLIDPDNYYSLLH